MLTLGAHTYAHPIFNNLSSEAIVKDINRANEIFMREFGFMPSHFAYPYGGRIEVSNAHFRLLENLNCYKTATTTRHGMIFNAHKNHLFALPRVFLSEDFKLESLYNFRKKRVVVD